MKSPRPLTLALIAAVCVLIGLLVGIAASALIARGADLPPRPLPVPWECKICPPGQAVRGGGQ